MADYQISATVTAQVQNFQQGMNAVVTSSNRAEAAVQQIDRNFRQAITQINGNVRLFGNSAQLTTQRIGAIQTAIDGLLRNGVRPADARIQSLVATMNRLNATSATTTRAMGASSSTYMNLGRVIQDLPFGFVGIQNNLTQLIPAAGAVGLAFSALVSAITFAQVGTGAWTRGLGENKKALDNSKKASEEYIASLDNVTQSHLKGAQNAQKEVVELKTLYGITQDTTLSVKQRKEAVDELQNQYPAYFKNIRDESFLAGGAKTAYDNLTTAIIATGKARAAQDIIVKNSSRQLENEQKIADLEKQQLKNQQLLATARKTAAAGDLRPSGATGGVSVNLVNTNNVGKALDTIADTEKQINNLKTDTNILTQRNLDLTKAITAEVKKGADLAGGIGDLPNSPVDKMKYNKLDGKAGGKKDFVDPTFEFRQAEGFRKLLRGLDAYQSGVSALEKTIDAAQYRMIQNAVAFNDKFSEIMTSGLVSSLSGIGDAIGNALATGGNAFEAVGKSLLSSLGGVLTQLGEMAIGVGIGLQAIKSALTSLNPVLAIGAGVALIALGSFFKSKASGIGGGIKGGGGSGVTAFANGGIVSGPTNALVGEYAGAKNNPEVIAPLNKLKSMLGNQEPFFQVIPIFDNKGLSIAVQRGNNQRGRI